MTNSPRLFLFSNMAIYVNDKKIKEAVKYLAKAEGKTMQDFIKDKGLERGFVYHCYVRRKTMSLSGFNKIMDILGLQAHRFLLNTKGENTHKFIPEFDLDKNNPVLESRPIIPNIDFLDIDRDTYFFVVSRIAEYLKKKFPQLKVQALIRYGEETQNDLLDVEIVDGVHVYMRFALDSKRKLYSCLDISDKYSKYDPSLMKKTYSVLSVTLLDRYCKIIERERLLYKQL